MGWAFHWPTKHALSWARKWYHLSLSTSLPKTWYLTQAAGQRHPHNSFQWYDVSSIPWKYKKIYEHGITLLNFRWPKKCHNGSQRHITWKEKAAWVKIVGERNSPQVFLFIEALLCLTEWSDYTSIWARDYKPRIFTWRLYLLMSFFYGLKPPKKVLKIVQCDPVPIYTGVIMQFSFK